MKTFAILSLLAFLFSFASCSDDDDPDPLQQLSTITYRVGNRGMSNIFKVNIVYKDEAGTEITLSNQDLPWQKEIKVRKPFTAYLRAKYVLNESAEIPETVTAGDDLSISADGAKWKAVASTFTIQKDKLPEWLENDPGTSLEYEITE